MPPVAKREGPACGRAENRGSDYRHGENLIYPMTSKKTYFK